MSSILKFLIAVIVALAIFLALRFFIDSFPIQPNVTDTQEQVSMGQLRDWREFKAPSGKFSALFPTLPQHAVDKIQDEKGEPRKYETYVSADGVGPAFMISTISLKNSSDKASSIDRLKKVVNDMLSRNKDNKLKQMNESKFGGNQAIDFVLNNDNVSVEGKVFEDDNTLYVLSMISKDNLPHAEDLDYFINSFKINHKN